MTFGVQTWSVEGRHMSTKRRKPGKLETLESCFDSFLESTVGASWMLHRMTREAGGECQILAADMVLIQFNSRVLYVQLLSFCLHGDAVLAMCRVGKKRSEHGDLIVELNWFGIWFHSWSTYAPSILFPRSFSYQALVLPLSSFLHNHTISSEPDVDQQAMIESIFQLD